MQSRFLRWAPSSDVTSCIAFRGNRDREPKNAPLPRFALYADLPSVTPDNFSGDVQSQTCSFRSTVGNLEELLKNSLVLFLGNTLPRIGDRESDEAIGRMGAQGDASLPRGMVHRVADKIGEDMPDPFLIGQHPDLRNGKIHTQMQTLGGRLRFVLFDGFLHEVGDRNRQWV